jgi:predicted transcriptional regulator
MRRGNRGPVLRMPACDELRARRLELGLTQQEVATRAGISQPLVARIESGDVDPRASTLRRVIDVLNQAATEKLPKARDLVAKDIASVTSLDPVRKAARIMREKGFSQLPVIDQGRPVGLLSVAGLVARVEQSDDPARLSRTKVADVMGPAPPVVDGDTRFATLDDLLGRSDAVLVSDGGRFIGIVTKADILTLL